MPSEGAAGFWSYAHDDNELDGDAILELARLIMEEYDLLSGESLNLFVDRDSIEWGQEWRERIDSSLAQTTFFIPIITPRYFKRPECIRELLEFAAKAKSLGVQELLLPILYIETPNLSTESPDEAIALAARAQYVDWRANRLVESRSREYRAAVNELALRLIEIARRVTDIQFNREVEADPDDNGIDGITDIVEKVSTLLPDWLDAVMDEKINQAQIDATWEQYGKQVTRLKKAHAPASAILTTRLRMAKEMLPLVERGLKDARIYLARSVELDPLISALTRLIAEYPDSSQLVAPVKDAINEAMVEIREHGDPETDSNHYHSSQWFSSMAHLGRIFQKIAAIFHNGHLTADEGNDIVRRWDAELNKTIARPEN